MCVLTHLHAIIQISVGKNNSLYSGGCINLVVNKSIKRINSFAKENYILSLREDIYIFAKRRILFSCFVYDFKFVF